MKQLKIKIGDKPIIAKLAYTDEEKARGLQGVTSLPDNEGMLFPFDDTEEVSI